jgi:hypothetical protein
MLEIFQEEIFNEIRNECGGSHGNTKNFETVEKVLNKANGPIIG